MPIKEKSTFRKYEFEYTSPDGDSCDITIVEHGDRRYIQFTQPNGETITIDGPMLLDMADKYREIMSARSKPELGVNAKSAKKPKLPSPKIVDHRTEKANQIESDVGESMGNYDDDIEPVESFSSGSRKVDNVDYAKVQSGVDYETLDGVSETPEEWSLKNKELSGWQKEAAQRQDKGRPSIRQRGDSGRNFKRIGAGDLI